MDNLKLNWEKILKYIEKEITPISYSTWFIPLNPVKCDENLNILYIAVEEEFIINTLKNRYMDIFHKAAESVFGEPYKIVIKLPEEYSSDNKSISSSEDTLSDEENSFSDEFILNPTYSFENFIVSDNNKYAYHAALAVAESPSQTCNPLFIYGGSGLGKTHLMHAIGHYILKNYPRLKILYISSEMFTNDFIKAIVAKRKNEGIKAFKKKYRDVDVLLIDDIQFIEGKDATELEFFHTFNTLYELNKQIVISSDRAPNKMKILDERLRSRFSWNLVADIQPPEYETRVAILKKQAELKNVIINENVLKVICMIAEKIKFNIRELIGAFSRIIVFSTVFNEEIDEKFAKRILKDILLSEDFTIDCNTIKKQVCKSYNLKISDIESSKRTRNITTPRQIAMYLCREMTDSSLPQIGKVFGGRDHTTVIHAHEKISKEIKKNPALKESVENLISILNDKR